MATALAVGAGDDEADGCLDDAVGDARTCSNSSAPPLPLTAMMQAIVHEFGDDDNDDESTGEDDLSWWCRHQFAYQTLARLAETNLAIPSSSAASKRVFLAAGNVVTKNHNKLGDYTVDALIIGRFTRIGTVKRSLAGDALQEGQVIFVFRVVATVGFVSTYTGRSE